MKLPKYRREYGAVLESLFLHLALLAVLAGHIPHFGFPGGGGRVRGNDERPIEIQPKFEQQPIEADLIEKPEEKPEAVPEWQKASHAGQNCNQFFGGIGIVTNGQSVITMVYEGYPAYKAGIRVGMTMITDVHSVRGEIGTVVDVQVQEQDGAIRTLSIVRDKICYEDVEKQLTNDR